MKTCGPREKRRGSNGDKADNQMKLSELIEQQKQKAKSAQAAPVDWYLRREKWLAELNDLLQRIEAWLCQGGVSQDEIEHFSLEISEEPLGRYIATGLRVQIGAAVVTFRPMGSVLIGACGRIDVNSDQPSTPSVKLIAELSESTTEKPSYEQGWDWLVYSGRAADAGFSLDEESLAKVLAVVLGEGSLS